MLTNEQQKSYQNSQICDICNEKIEDKYTKDKSCCTVRDHCHYTGKYRVVVHSIFNLKYHASKEVSIVFPNGSNYDFHFIIKELPEKC